MRIRDRGQSGCSTSVLLASGSAPRTHFDVELARQSQVGNSADLPPKAKLGQTVRLVGRSPTASPKDPTMGASTPGRPAPAPSQRTLQMSVANMTFLVDRLGADCAPGQFIRELT